MNSYFDLSSSFSLALLFVLGVVCTFAAGFLFGFICAALRYKNKQAESFSEKLSALMSQLSCEIKELTNENRLNSNEVKFAINETSKLTKALTTNQNLKGTFGEDCLETILNSCFLTQNIDYIKQLETYNEDNKKIKPDYVINLPNNRNIIIDCKLNLEKFIEYNNSLNSLDSINFNNSNNSNNFNNYNSFNDSNSYKNELIKDLNNTINNLSNKKYETAANLSQPDFILMYIPIEPLITLIYTDSDFLSVIKNASEKNIVIVGNSSIITSIRLINSIWRNYSQEKNVDRIIEIAHQIYNLIAQHSINLSQMKKAIDEIYNSFNREFDKIANDNKLFRITQELQDCGIKAQNKKLGRKLSEVSIDKMFL